MVSDFTVPMEFIVTMKLFSIITLSRLVGRHEQLGPPDVSDHVPGVLQPPLAIENTFPVDDEIISPICK